MSDVVIQQQKLADEIATLQSHQQQLGVAETDFENRNSAAIAALQQTNATLAATITSLQAKIGAQAPAVDLSPALQALTTIISTNDSLLAHLQALDGAEPAPAPAPEPSSGGGAVQPLQALWGDGAAPPTGLTASSQSPGAISASCDSYAGATSYSFSWGTTSGSHPNAQSVPGPSATIPGLSPGTYFVVVQALRTGASTDESSEVSVKVD